MTRNEFSELPIKGQRNLAENVCIKANISSLIGINQLNLTDLEIIQIIVGSFYDGSIATNGIPKLNEKERLVFVTCQDCAHAWHCIDGTLRCELHKIVDEDEIVDKQSFCDKGEHK